MDVHRPFLSTHDVLTTLLGDIEGVNVVDLGCGSGRLTRSLLAMGAQTCGVEPNERLAAMAAEHSSNARFVIAGAENTGLEDSEFDVSVFSLSLHHVVNMDAAIMEAARITKSGGLVLVIEPEAPDPVFPVMQFIDDESAVYLKAQSSLQSASKKGVLKPVGTLHFAEKYRIESPQAMVEDVASIDSGRILEETDRSAFEQAFHAALQRDQNGSYIPYWCRADLFKC